MTLGEKLSRLRKENNYTQEQLADILGVSRQAISKWESDGAYPETDKLIRLATLFHCSMDYLVRDDVDEKPTTQQNSERSQKLSKLLSGILRFAPMVLYSLWALLLWAFYATSLLKIPGGNLYQWFGNAAASEMQPAIRALISLGVISCVYIAALGVLQRFASKKINLIANICSFVFQVAIFVCAMSIIGVAKSIGLQCGKVVVVVSTVTGSFAMLQAVFIALNHYFSSDGAIDLTPKRTIAFFRSSGKYIVSHKVMSIVIACVLLVGIALSIVLPLTVGNIFRANKVAKIQLGDSRDTVTRVLGKPMDIDTKKIADLLGDESLNLSKQDVYMYSTPKVERLLKQLIRTIEKLDNNITAEDAVVLVAKLQKLEKDFNKLEFPYVGVYYENGKVEGVELNAKFSMERANDVKWNVKGNKKQSIQLIPNVVPYGETPYSAELYAKVFYTDGSYRLGRIENVSAVGNAGTGWTINWSDDWGEYTRFIKESTDKASFVERGEWQDNVSYVISNAYGDVSLGYSLKIITNGSMVDGSMAQFDFEEYRDQIVQVTVSDGISKLPSGVFANFTNLTTAKLPSSLEEIGDRVFYGCSKLESVTLPSNITTIGNGAFQGCSALAEVTLPDGITTIGDYAFYGCSKLTSVQIPGDSEEYTEHRTTIGAHAFDGSGLTEIYIPNRVIYVGDMAYANCANLTNVRWFSWYITQYTLPGENIFANTPNLTTVSVGGSGCIPPKLFKNCSSITTVTLYDSAVGAEAFRNCTSITELNYSTIDSVYDYAFAGCTSLTSVSINGSVRIGAFEGCTSLKSVDLTYDNWAYDAEVGDRAFYGCTALTDVNFSEDTTQIGNSAFYGCTSLTELDLSNVYYIYAYAFAGCTNLKSVTLYHESWRLAPDNGTLADQFNITVSSNYDAAVKLTSTYSYCDWFFR